MNALNQQEPAEGFVSLPEGKLHYLDWGGSGLQLHFLHANGFCAGTYSPFLKYLIDDYHILASDVRGHGNSIFPRSTRIRNWEIFADDLKRIIEQAMTAPIIGMGHSLGAVTTYIAAAKYPHLFSGIILLDPVIFPTRILWRIAILRLLGLSGKYPLAHGARKRKRTFKDKQSALKRFAAGRGIFKTWSKDFIDAYLQCGLLIKDSETALLRCDPELEAQIFESVPINVWKYAKFINCPVLIIRGEHTDTFFPQAADRLKKIIPMLEVVSIPNAGHFVPMEKPQECARVVADFVRRSRLI